MKITITGSQGFIGKNLASRLYHLPNIQLQLLNRSADEKTFYHALKETDLIIHLAGESRSREVAKSFTDNLRLTKLITSIASKTTPVIFASTNRKNHLEYWQTKLQEETILKEHFSNLLILRMDNVFGKWAKPFYNSVVATFIDGTLHEKTFPLFDGDTPIPFVYIDEVVAYILDHYQNLHGQHIETISGQYYVSANTLLQQIQAIHQAYQAGIWLHSKDDFLAKLQITYLSCLPPKQWFMTPPQYPDQRGNFIELMKGSIPGQVSLNVIHPNQKKGNHYHHIRWEKFMVLNGQGSIRLRQKFNSEIITFSSQDIQFKLLTIPPGYLHEIANSGSEPMMVWMWSSLVYDPANPDTYPELV